MKCIYTGLLELLENAFNKYLYIKRFKELAYNKYYVENNILYYRLFQIILFNL